MKFKKLLFLLFIFNVVSSCFVFCMENKSLKRKREESVQTERSKIKQPKDIHWDATQKYVNETFHKILGDNPNQSMIDFWFSDLNIDIDYIDKQGLTALHIAVFINNKELVKRLLKYEPNENLGIRNKDAYCNDWSPETLAMMSGYKDILEILQNYSKNKNNYLYI